VNHEKIVIENPLQANHYFEKGLRVLQSNNCLYAIYLLSVAVDMDSRFGEAYGYRGLAYFTLGLHEEAMEDYNAALSLDPSLDKVYFFRGALHLELKHYEDAVNDFTVALEWDNHFADAYYYRGICRGLLDEQKGALLDLKFAAQLGNRIAQKVLNEKGVVW
jgi:tetratricopeptide (TPR) repeat protein